MTSSSSNSNTCSSKRSAAEAVEVDTTLKSDNESKSCNNNVKRRKTESEQQQQTTPTTITTGSAALLESSCIVIDLFDNSQLSVVSDEEEDNISIQQKGRHFPSSDNDSSDDNNNEDDDDDDDSIIEIIDVATGANNNKDPKWSCPRCTFANDSADFACLMCGTTMCCIHDNDCNSDVDRTCSYSHATTTSASVDRPTAMPVSSSTSSAPPVDEDIGNDYYNYSVVQDDTNNKWYDVVLNQCNITNSSNNNKYYIIQLVRKMDHNINNNNNGNPGQFYVWTKWGRVGDSSTGCAMKGPFSTVRDAHTLFVKKYREKTANSWNTNDDAFQPKHKKYTKLDIDNRVGEGMKANLYNTPYNFNVTLKEMPIGILTRKQILIGVAILDKIKNKLEESYADSSPTASASNDSGSSSCSGSSYAKLSSQFYTAIPHPFGLWTRPPVISSFGVLSECYEKCQRINNELEQLQSMQKAMSGK